MTDSSSFPRPGRAFTDTVAALGTDFNSQRPEDYIDVLNRLAAAIGAVPNMGVYADITAVVPHRMLRVRAREEYVTVKTSDVEVPGRKMSDKGGPTAPDQMTFRQLLGSCADAAVDGQHTGVLMGTVESHHCPPKVDCSQCGGNGKCQECRGKGKLECTECDGKGKCTECDGKGKTDCDDCDGSGQCHTCDGEGHNRCNVCGGSGKCHHCGGTGFSDTPCHLCGGEGKVVAEDTGRKRKCPNCNGKGVEPCSHCSRTSEGKGRCATCDGTGLLKCNDCHGTGKCHTCKGKGTVSCSTCKGTGKCTKCKGTGKVTCGTCKGDGKCGNCRGTGKVTCSRCEGTGWYQTYTEYVAKKKVVDTMFVDAPHYKDILQDATGHGVFSGPYRRWNTAKNMEFDHTDRLRSAAREALGDNKVAIDNFILEHHGESGKGSHYQSVADAVVVPAVRIDFMLENTPHSAVIVGLNGKVLHDSLPSRLEQYKVGFFKRIGMAFNRKNRLMEYIRLAAYIFNLDGRDPAESQLLNAFVRRLNLSSDGMKQMYAELRAINVSMSRENLRYEIRHLLTSKRTLTFAWQCMLRDGTVSEQEQQLWDWLVSEFGVGGDEAEALKRNAARYIHLSDDALVDEYMQR